MRSFIAGTGSYAPEKILTNRELEAMVETSDDWIVERTGIRERRIAAPEEATSDLALKASIRALEMAALDPRGRRGDRGRHHHARLPVPPPPGRCCRAGWGTRRRSRSTSPPPCAGSLYALAVADRFVASGAVKNALVVGVDTLTRITDWTDRNTCILFGGRRRRDGAPGPATIRARPPPTRLHSDGSLVPILYQPGGGSASRSRRRSSARSRTT